MKIPLAQYDSQMTVIVRIAGNRALFTNPSMGTMEKFSYPTLPPSAARGIITSIFGKPQMEWIPLRIYTAKPGRRDTCVINERQLSHTKNTSPFIGKTCQIHMSYLRDVEYFVEVSPFVHIPFKRKNPNDKNFPGKYISQLVRRLERGTYFKKPYLGRSEFTCETTLEHKWPEEQPMMNANVPSLLNGIVHNLDGTKKTIFFNAEIKGGNLNVPFLVCNPGGGLDD